MFITAAITLAANNLFAPKFQDGRYLRTFNVRKTETFFIIFYATVEIGNVSFFNARFTYVNFYATVEIHLKASVCVVVFLLNSDKYLQEEDKQMIFEN